MKKMKMEDRINEIQDFANEHYVDYYFEAGKGLSKSLKINLKGNIKVVNNKKIIYEGGCIETAILEYDRI